MPDLGDFAGRGAELALRMAVAGAVIATFLLGTIREVRAGIVASVDRAHIMKLARIGGTVAVVVRRVGDFVATGMPLVKLHGGGA